MRVNRKEIRNKNTFSGVVCWKKGSISEFCRKMAMGAHVCLQKSAAITVTAAMLLGAVFSAFSQFPAYASDKAVETVYLGTPVHVWWETDTTGKWSSVLKAHEYQVKLYIGDYVERDEDNWRKVNFDDESMDEAECVMTKRTGETSCDFSVYMDDLHTYFFVVRATPKVSEQAYVKAGSWVASPDADYREKQVIGYTNGTWRNYLEGSRYQLEDGSYLGAGWQLIEANWYLFDNQGYRLTGWQERDGNRYYLGDAGQLATGWFVWNDDWYYADKDGVMQTGWIMTEPGKYYYMDKSGVWIEDAVRNEEQ